MKHEGAKGRKGEINVVLWDRLDGKRSVRVGRAININNMHLAMPDPYKTRFTAKARRTRSNARVIATDEKSDSDR